MVATVEKIPQFGTLVFRVPLAEVVAVGEEALFGAGFLLVAAAATEAGVVLVELDGVEQGDSLEFVAGGVGAFFFNDAAAVDGVLDGADDEGGADEFHELVAVGHGFVEIVPGVDVDEREGHAGGPKGLAGEPGHDDGVLAAGEEQGGVLELGGRFAKDEDRFGFELIELAEVVVGHGGVDAETLKTEMLKNEEAREGVGGWLSQVKK